MADRRSPARLLPALALLYLGQGLPMGLAFEALPAQMRAQGFGTAQIGLVGLAILPWALRFLWAPLIDRWSGGHRARLLLPLQVALFATYLLAAVLPDSGGRGWASLGLVVFASLLAATQNTATDGLAVLALPRERLGWANGFQVGGFSLGMLLGGGLVLVVQGIAGWMAAWLLPALLVLIAMPLLRGLHRSVPPRRQEGRARISLRAFLERPRAAVMLSIAASFFFGRSFVGDLIGPALHDAGLDMAQIGVTRMAGTAAMAISATTLGAACIARFGASRAGPAGGVAWAFALLGWVALLRSGAMDPMLATALSVADGLAGGVTYAAFLTLFMRWASANQAGTDVTVLMSTETMSNIAAMLLGGMTAGRLGLPATFELGAMLMLAAMLWAFLTAPPIDRPADSKEARHAHP